MNNKLIVALDVDTMTEAERLLDLLLPEVKIFKVGIRLFTACGPKIVKMISSRGAKVFLDLKFCDIPNVVSRAIESAAGLGVFMLTVHILGSRRMLTESMKAVRSIARAQRPLIIGVTVLTSFNQDALREIGIEKPLIDEVLSLALIAKQEGLDGVVCSPREVAPIRRQFKKDFIIVTPGIRPAGSQKDDQQRTMTPKQAREEGVDYMVVGRPIIASPDPQKSARRILTEIC